MQLLELKLELCNLHTQNNIKGNINNFDVSKLEKYKVASLDEIHLGKAEIILQKCGFICYNIALSKEV